MFGRLATWIVFGAVLLAAGVLPAEAARYRYGTPAGGGGTGEAGFFLFLEGITANPRNTDSVVATTEAVEDFGGGTNTLSQIVPQWENDFAGRFGGGYGWGEGHSVVASFWGFQTDQTSSGSGPSGGFTHFAIGPPIRRTSGDYVGDQGSPGSWDMKTEIEAATADVAYVHTQAVAETFTLAWSGGLRYATYEERTNGSYDEASIPLGVSSFLASKSNEGEMIGVRGALRGRWRFAKSFAIDAALGLAFLDGELRGRSSLTPSGSGNSATTPASLAEITDDSRSGTQRDMELTASWFVVGEAVRIWAGWEQQVWEGIVTDQVRNFPGTSAPLRNRDSVTLSGYKLGVFVRF
jgi:hypothetical protein